MFFKSKSERTRVDARVGTYLHFFFFFQHCNASDFVQVMWNNINEKIHSLTFCIELSSKFVWVNLCG